MIHASKLAPIPPTSGCLIRPANVLASLSPECVSRPLARRTRAGALNDEGLQPNRSGHVNNFVRQRGRSHDKARYFRTCLPEEARGKRGKLRDLQKVPHSYSTAAPFVRPAQRAPHDPNIALAAVRPCQMKHQDVQGLEGEGLHREQIRRPEVGGVVGQEGAPGLARRLGRPAPPVALDRALGRRPARASATRRGAARCPSEDCLAPSSQSVHAPRR